LYLSTPDSLGFTQNSRKERWEILGSLLVVLLILVASFRLLSRGEVSCRCLVCPPGKCFWANKRIWKFTSTWWFQSKCQRRFHA